MMNPGTTKASEEGGRNAITGGVSEPGRTYTANQFQAQFTSREEELQKLLATERQRGEQRRKNYLQLKDEHLALQNEHVNIQLELKQVLEEVKHLKDMKNHEVEQLLKKLEDRNRQITKLEKTLADHNPEVLRLKFAEELEEPLRQSEREKMRLENDKNKLQNELKIVRLQVEHNDREHEHMIQEIKNSYSQEIIQLKAEKEEYKSRLAEVQLPADAKRILELREENSALKRRLDDSNATIETAKQEYLLIQNQISNLAKENTVQLTVFEDEIAVLKNELAIKQKEVRKVRSLIQAEKSQNEELAAEIVRLKQNDTKVKQNLNDFIRESQREKDELQKLFDDERENIKIDLNRLRNEIKNRFETIQNKDIAIQELQDKIVQKERETIERIRTIQSEDNERIFQLEQNKRLLEINVEELESIRAKNKDELAKYDTEMAKAHERTSMAQQEIYNLKSKIQSFELMVEELQHVRRQHRQLHEDSNRLQAENVQLFNEIREVKHHLSISKEDLKLYKEKIQASKLAEQELRIENDKMIVKINRKHEEEINELMEKMKSLEKDNVRVKNESKMEHNRLYLLKAKQCNKIAHKLNEFLAELKEPTGSKKKVEHSSNLKSHELNKETVQQHVIGELENIHEKLRTLELYSQQLNSFSHSADSVRK